MAAFLRYMRANPQVLALLIICLVLGIGTFLAVVFGLVSSGSQTTNGEPSGWQPPTHVIVATVPPVGQPG